MLDKHRSSHQSCTHVCLNCALSCGNKVQCVKLQHCGSCLQGCPCTHERICDGSWPGGLLQEDGRGPIDRQACDFVNRPGQWANPYPGWWYMLHGGESATCWYASALMLPAAQSCFQCSWCMRVVLSRCFALLCCC